MELRSWDPGQPLGLYRAVDHVDGDLVEPLARPRSFEGGVPPFLAEALPHCSKAFILRSMEREVVDPTPTPLDPIPLRSLVATDYEPATARLPILTCEVAAIVPRTTCATRSATNSRPHSSATAAPS